MSDKKLDLISSEAAVSMRFFSPVRVCIKYGKVFPTSFTFEFSAVESEVYDFVEYLDKVVMWQFSVQGAKVKGGNLFCFSSVIDLVKLL